MVIERKVGLEAEFLLRNTKGDLIIPPSHFDRDGFPLLGEIRGEPGKNAGETVSNFVKAKMELIQKLNKGHSIQFAARERCPLALYKKANSQMDWEQKGRDLGKVLNIHGINLEDYSDQILSKGKIQGVWVSCGLHVHFSCEDKAEEKIEEQEYELVRIPLTMHIVEPGFDAENLAMEVARPELQLYRRKEFKTKKTIVARSSQLNVPTTRYIVEEMDKAFFDRFAPPESERTKFRQPGFLERKVYGFEYRSLPFTDEVEANLLEIAQKSFDLLKATQW